MLSSIVIAVRLSAKARRPPLVLIGVAPFVFSHSSGAAFGLSVHPVLTKPRIEMPRWQGRVGGESPFPTRVYSAALPVPSQAATSSEMRDRGSRARGLLRPKRSSRDRIDVCYSDTEACEWFDCAAPGTPGPTVQNCSIVRSLSPDRGGLGRAPTHFAVVEIAE